MEPLMTRRHSLKALIGSLGASVVLAAALVVGAAWFPPFAVLAPVPVLIAAVRAWLVRAGSAYRLHPERLELELGVFSRRIENLELFRVRDVGVRQGLLGRLLNFGEVYVHSTDSSAPDLHLAAIDAPREFYEALRRQVTESRAHRQTMIVEEGRAMIE